MADATVKLEVWRSMIREELPFASTTVVDGRVREACIEFCKETSLWSVLMDAQTVQVGRSEYELFLPDNSRLHSILELKYQGKPLDARVLADLERNENNWKARTGAPREYTMLDSQTVRLIGIPQERVEKALTGTIVLIPKRSSTTVPEFLFEDWGKEIAEGAKAELYAMKNAPWFDRTHANDSQASFQAAIARARSVAAVGHTKRAVRRTRAHFF